MFETAELGNRLGKEEYAEIVPNLRIELLEAQRALQAANFSVLILVNGQDAAGRSETINLLHEWLDARYLTYTAFDEATSEEKERPEYWRYWIPLPPHGRIAIFSDAYYFEYLRNRVFGGWTDGDLDAALRRARGFEKALVENGTLIIKLWLHIDKRRQKKRLKKLEDNSSTRWRVSKADWARYEHYDDLRRVAERIVRQTSSAASPWHVVESANARYRSVTVARLVRDAIRQRLSSESKHTVVAAEPIEDPVTILDSLDLTQSVGKEEYAAELERLQGRVNVLARAAREKNASAILVFEGWDAAGKGGAIRRLIHPLEARQFRVIPVAAPTDEEKAHHYLWRFWRYLPRQGRITIYDRSWYGRVLVERVEGFASEEEWSRAYEEINDFEEMLTDFGIVLMKFWMHVSRDEQLRRFEERERIPYKRHKITEEDYRNREKSNNYEAAANDMIGRTSTEYAPWTLVEAENKHFGRLRVLRTVCERLEEVVG